MITKNLIESTADDQVEDLLKEIEDYVANIPQTFTLKKLKENPDKKMFNFMIFVHFVPKTTEGKFGYYQAMLCYYTRFKTKSILSIDFVNYNARFFGY